MKKNLIRALALAAPICGIVANAGATVIYSTGFETPTYATGNIVGQDSWTTTTGGGNMLVASSAAAHSGSQFLAYTPALTAAVPSKFDWKPLNVPATSFATENLLNATVYMGMASTAGATRDQTIGMDIYNIDGSRIAALNYSNAGLITLLTVTGAVTPTTVVTASLDTYHKVSIDVNYTTGSVTYSFDDVVLGTGVTTATTLGDVDMYALRLTTGTGAVYRTEAWDDLSVTTSVATPEPTTCLIALPLAIGAISRRRQRRS